MRTIGALVEEITGRKLDAKLLGQLASWPPDLFAITAAILHESGAYRRVVSPPGDEVWPHTKRWQTEIRKQSAKWVTWATRQLKTGWDPETKRPTTRSPIEPSRLAGVPLTVVRDRLGHSSERVTEKHYLGRTTEFVCGPFADEPLLTRGPADGAAVISLPPRGRTSAA